MKGLSRGIGILGLLAVLGCSVGPEPITWGVDSCDQCRMILTDKRFGAEWVDPRGRVYKFDGLDELAKFLAAREIEGTAYVSHGEEGALIPAQGAVYVSSPEIRGPMGGHVMAFADRAEAEAFLAPLGLSNVHWLSYDEALKEAGNAAR